MANVLVIGESGSGKSTSMRNLDPASTLLIQIIPKPLPFRSKKWAPVDPKTGKGTVVSARNHRTIIKWIEAAPKMGKTQVVIDDFQYLMAFDLFEKAKLKGYEKFTDIAQAAYYVLRAGLESDVNVYYLTHSNEGDDGITRIKTVGRMIDEKLVIEGLFTVVLRSMLHEGEYVFSTKSNADTVKTPMGMFEDMYIENDLNAVNSVINEYYGMDS